MVLRAALLGLLMWLLATAAFRFAGHVFYDAGTIGPTVIFYAAAPVMIGVAWLVVRLLRVTRGDEGEACVALAFPGMLLDAFVVPSFGVAFPNLDPTLDGEFGGTMLIAYAAIIFTGLLLTRLSPQDERL
jgi:hypothetical protein